MQESGIYRYYNIVNGKSYVGRAKNLRHRHIEHLSLLNKGIEPCTKLNNAWQKYGADKFAYEVLCYCDEEDLNAMERMYIEHFDSFRNGYNCNEGGSGNSGFTHTDETKQRISNARRGSVASDATRSKLSAWQIGKRLTDEHKASISRAWTDSRKQELSRSRTGAMNPNYGKTGIDSCHHSPVVAHTGEFFATLLDAAKWCGLSTSGNISSCCNGKRPYAGKHPISGERLSWRKATNKEIETFIHNTI